LRVPFLPPERVVGAMMLFRWKIVLVLSGLLGAACVHQPKSESIVERIPRLIRDFAVPGVAVVVIDGGKVTQTESFGYADVGHLRPVTKETTFNVGSISKNATAWGVGSLGLDLDDPIERHLLSFRFGPSGFDSKEVTLRRVLSHTAGLSLAAVDGVLHTPEPLSDWLKRVDIIAKPGAGFLYSGGGYGLLQQLIEDVSGESFPGFMQERVFARLGMKRTAYEWNDALMRDAAVPYSSWGEPVPYEQFSATAAGGLVTTAPALARLALASLTPEAAFMEAPIGPDHRTGLGYFVETLTNGRRAVGHTGANPGWAAMYLVVPEAKAGIVILTNSDNGWELIRAAACSWLKSTAGAGTKRYCMASVAAKLFATTQRDGLAAAVSEYRALRLASSADYELAETELNRLGYRFLRRQRIREAIAFLSLNVESFPRSSNAHQSLSEALLAAGNRDAAMTELREALRLDPSNQQATEDLEGMNNRLKVITRRAYGFRTYRATEVALYHSLGKLPEPHALSAHRFC
jgi:CubicO group peptidase (beta-lactamase class C family)